MRNRSPKRETISSASSGDSRIRAEMAFTAGPVRCHGRYRHNLAVVDVNHSIIVISSISQGRTTWIVGWRVTEPALALCRFVPIGVDRLERARGVVRDARQ